VKKERRSIRKMTRLIVISAEKSFPGELAIVNEMFREGMELFHFRKPFINAEDQRNFLNGIHPFYYNRISIHQHKEQVKEFDLQYLHVKDAERPKHDERVNDGLIRSTSFHSATALNKEGKRWDYCLMSPFSKGISKSHSLPVISGEFNPANAETKVYALGGVHSGNVQQALDKGYFGVAACGYIWEDVNSALRNFKEINSLCMYNDLTY
jgi:thiamine-phosphate pyrophosphorylase